MDTFLYAGFLVLAGAGLAYAAYEYAKQLRRHRALRRTQLRRSRDFLSRAVSGSGEVVSTSRAVERVVMGGLRRDPRLVTYTPVVRYRDGSGEVREEEVEAAVSSLQAPSPGDEVDVLYDAAAPQRVRLTTHDGYPAHLRLRFFLLGYYAVLGPLAVVCTLVCLGVLWLFLLAQLQ